jgi:hypothetical protein
MTYYAIQPGKSGNEHILDDVLGDREWLGSPKSALEVLSLSYEYVPLSHRTHHEATRQYAAAALI